MVPSHCWSWHGQKHRTPRCRSAQFLYGLLWINVSWMPHKSSRIFVFPVQWKNIDITFHIFKRAISRHILLQLFILQKFTDRTVHPIMGQLQCELDEGIWTGLALLDQALSKITKGDDVRVHIISQSRGHRQRVGNHSLALPWNAKHKRQNIKQVNSLAPSYPFKQDVKKELSVFLQWSVSYTDLRWDIPLESLRSRQIRVRFSFTVAIFCVAQLNRVHRECMLHEKYHQGLH